MAVEMTRGQHFLLSFWGFIFCVSLTFAITQLSFAQFTARNIFIIVVLVLISVIAVWRGLALFGLTFSMVVEKLELSRRDLLWLIVPSAVFIFFYFFQGAGDAAAAGLLVLVCQIVLRLMRKGMRDWKKKYRGNKGV